MKYSISLTEIIFEAEGAVMEEMRYIVSEQYASESISERENNLKALMKTYIHVVEKELSQGVMTAWANAAE